MSEFFVSCPIGFEKELLLEFESFWFQMIDLDGMPTRCGLPEFEIIKGGIQFKTDLHLGLQINFFSKIAYRVLLRLTSFQARFFDQFEKKMTEIKFETLFNTQEVSLSIESSQSRLFHEKNLTECMTKVLMTKKIKVNDASQNSIYIRINKDLVVISLDTTGPHLHFRGYREQQGEAPLRENLAALVLKLAELPKENSALLDPYCGSGTFFFEKNLENLPNFYRKYSFFEFKNCPALFKSATWRKNFHWLVTNNSNYFIGFDKNAETVLKLNHNSKIYNEHFYPIEIKAKCIDSETFDWSSLDIFKNKIETVVITNPPYGERSKQGQVMSTLLKLEKIDQVFKMVVIHPKSWSFNFGRLKLLKQIPLSNQGLETVVSVFTKV